MYKIKGARVLKQGSTKGRKWAVLKDNATRRGYEQVGEEKEDEGC